MDVNYKTLSDEEREAIASFGRVTGGLGQSRLRAGFLAHVDRDTPGLPADERQSRAEALYRAHMRELATSRHARNRARIEA